VSDPAGSSSSSRVRPASPRTSPRSPFVNSNGSSSSGGGESGTLPLSPGAHALPLLLLRGSSSSSSGVKAGEIMGASSSPRATASTPLSRKTSSTGSGAVGTAPPVSPRASSTCTASAGLLQPGPKELSGLHSTSKPLLKGGNSLKSKAAERTVPSSSSSSRGGQCAGPSSSRSSLGVPLLRTSSSSSSVSSLQMAALGPQAVGAAGARSLVQSASVRPPNRPVGWWVCGGLAVAAVAGGAVAAVYGVLTYVLKVSMVRPTRHCGP
jgi:hypothetical protein